MPKIPKTLVVGINLHGEIPLDSNNIPQKEKVPVNYIVTKTTIYYMLFHINILPILLKIILVC